jgi:hypothetical protein
MPSKLKIDHNEELGRRYEGVLINHSTTKKANNEEKTVPNFSPRLGFL